jgi:nucleoid DNA-binding protein
MTKSGLVVKIAKRTDLNKELVEKVLNGFFIEIRDTLKNGDEVTLRGFGTFKTVTYPNRKGRNPKTGKPIRIHTKTNGKFVPGKTLKDVNRLPCDYGVTNRRAYSADLNRTE